MCNYAGKPLLNLSELSNTIINITEGTVNIFNIERLRFDINKNLSDNNFSEDDAIVCSGSVVVNFLTGNIISEIGIKKYKLIIHNAVKKCYEILKEMGE